jgi:hypothetical protein
MGHEATHTPQQNRKDARRKAAESLRDSQVHDQTAMTAATFIRLLRQPRNPITLKTATTSSGRATRSVRLFGALPNEYGFPAGRGTSDAQFQFVASERDDLMGDFLHSAAELVPPDRRDAFLRSVANRVRDVRVVNAYDVRALLGVMPIRAAYTCQ